MEISFLFFKHFSLNLFLGREAADADLGVAGVVANVGGFEAGVAGVVATGGGFADADEAVLARAGVEVGAFRAASAAAICSAIWTAETGVVVSSKIMSVQSMLKITYPYKLKIILALTV